MKGSVSNTVVSPSVSRQVRVTAKTHRNKRSCTHIEQITMDPRRVILGLDLETGGTWHVDEVNDNHKARR